MKIRPTRSTNGSSDRQPKVDASDGRGVIAHLVQPYLFLTGSWIYGQIANIDRYRQIILTSKTENLDVFPFKPIFSYGDLLPHQKILIRLRNNGFNDVYRNFFYGVLKKHAAMLMHCHFGYCGVEFVDIKRKLKLPMVTSFYGSDMSLLPRDPRWRRKYEVFFGEGEQFLVEGTCMKAGLMELGSRKNALLSNISVSMCNDFLCYPDKWARTIWSTFLWREPSEKKRGYPMPWKPLHGLGGNIRICALL